MIAPRMEGTAIDIDPGPHTFTFRAADGTQAQQTVVVLEGQKAQLVSATLASAPPAPAPAPAAPPTASAPPATAAPTPVAKAGVQTTALAPSFWTTQREISVAVGGLGLAGVIVGGVFGTMSETAAHQQTLDCVSVTTCPNHAQAITDHNQASTDGAIATVGVIGGAALLAGGAAFFLLGSDDAGSPPKKDLTEISVVPQVGVNRIGLLFTREF